MAEEVASKRIKTEKDHGAGPEPDGAAPEGGRSDGEIFVKIQSEVLRCRICLEPLKPPVFKCEAGHVLCSVCMEKLREVGSVLGLGIFCDTYGCNESIIYHEKEKHETECTHAPCCCPENDCDFRGATCCLLEHLVTAHGWSPTNFSYNKPLKISVARDHRFTLLVGEDQTMFLLTNTLTEIGSAITMVCVRPHESEPSYSCNISAAQVVAGGKTEGRLVFQKDPLVSSSSLVGGVQLGKFFLLVPPELTDSSSGELTVHIRVDRLDMGNLGHTYGLLATNLSK
ncbi:hypothetical protein ACQ4PT_043591 [Festuca glaucescens]